MAASLVTTTTEFLQGRHRQKHFFQKHSTSRACQLLWGTLHGQNRSSRFFNEEHVSLRCSSSKKMPGVVVLGNAFTSITKESKQGDEASSEHVIHFYRIPLIQESVTSEFLKLVQTRISSQIVGLKTEQCVNIGLDSELSSKKLAVLKWFLQETCQPENLGSESFLAEEKIVGSHPIIVEVVPRLFVTTAWSANAASICKACGLVEVKHLERLRRYLLYVRPGNGALQDSEIDGFAAMVHDQITERFYIQKQTSFKASVVSEEVRSVQAMDIGLAFDEQDNQYYGRVFRDEIKQNPTAGKLFDIARSNAEHSTPWSTLQANPCNSVIGFMDNSKAIKGFPVKQLRLVQPGSTCTLDKAASDLDILCTTGSHNFPRAVAPYSSGASGHMSDTHATGGGSFVAVSTASCGIGNLGGNNCNEDPSFPYPSNPAFPLQIFNDARNSSSDDGDKFGVPLIQGYTRSFRQIDYTHISKEEPDIGMLVVKFGGAACHLGMRGGAAPNMASSRNYAELDLDTVQHGDAERTEKLYRVVQACIKMGEKNPIITIQDEGDGGICKVMKEIICPKGAEIDIRAIVIGDHKMSVLEIRGAEYEEQDAILVKPESRGMLQSICEREGVSMAVIGIISGEGCACLLDDSGVQKCMGKGIPPPAPAVDLETEEMLCGEMPQECSDLYHLVDTREPLDVARGEVVVMAVPKKRTSKSKTRIRRNCWLRKGQKAARYAFSLAKSISTGKSKSFMLSK